jgi:hypothetical protein
MGCVIVLADETQPTLMVIEKKNNVFQASWHNIAILCFSYSFDLYKLL